MSLVLFYEHPFADFSVIVFGVSFQKPFFVEKIRTSLRL
jgi:hypothetical protein